jgi:hypothetical protein
MRKLFSPNGHFSSILFSGFRNNEKFSIFVTSISKDSPDGNQYLHPAHYHDGDREPGCLRRFLSDSHPFLIYQSFRRKNHEQQDPIVIYHDSATGREPGSEWTVQAKRTDDEMKEKKMK